MKKHFWQIVVLGVLSLILAACGCTVSATPTLNVPSAGLRTSDGALTLIGTGLPDHDVQVLVDGQVAGATRSDEDGAWSLEITLTEPGEHELRVQTLAFNGVVIGEAAPVTATRAGLAEPEEAPAPPAVEVKPPTLKLPAGAAELIAGALALTGTGEPGSEVQVVADGQVAGVVQVGDDGSWSLDITLAEAGEHKLVVKTLDASGDVIAEAEPVSLSLAPPAVEVKAPTLKLPAGAVKLEAGALALTGTGEPGSDVQIVVDGQAAGVAQVDDDGSWSLELTVAETGEHELVMQTLDASGEVVAESEPVSLSLTPTGSVVLGPDLLFPADGADVITGQVVVGQLTLIGSGEPGTEVEILDGSDVLDTAQVNAEGEWYYTFEPEAGDHRFAARSLADTTATSNVIEVRVAEPDEGIDCNSNPGIERVNTYVVGTCDTLSGIGRELGISLDAVIGANPEIEDPDLIFPGQFITIP